MKNSPAVRKATLKPSPTGRGYLCPVCETLCHESHIVSHMRGAHTGLIPSRSEIANLKVMISVEYEEVSP